MCMKLQGKYQNKKNKKNTKKLKFTFKNISILEIIFVIFVWSLPSIVEMIKNHSILFLVRIIIKMTNYKSQKNKNILLL